MALRLSRPWTLPEVSIRAADGEWPLLFEIVISVNTPNFNLHNYLVSTYGWDGVQSYVACITINNGVTVYSLSPSIPAFQVGAAPTRCTVILNVLGTIIGAGGLGGQGGGSPTLSGQNGGNGGKAFEGEVNLLLMGSGFIKSGGGGGGGGGGWNSGGGPAPSPAPAPPPSPPSPSPSPSPDGGPSPIPSDGWPGPDFYDAPGLGDQPDAGPPDFGPGDDPDAGPVDTPE